MRATCLDHFILLSIITPITLSKDTNYEHNDSALLSNTTKYMGQFSFI